MRTVFVAGILVLGMPFLASAYSNYSNHTFAPYTYVNTMPQVNVNATSYANAYAYSYYPYSSYSYPSYSYPSYSTNNSYAYPQYSRGYQSAPSYASSYRSDNGEYCYESYGCYPLEVKDPHQWVYDKWTGTWY